jgi:hypothetical protein
MPGPDHVKWICFLASAVFGCGRIGIEPLIDTDIRDSQVLDSNTVCSGGDLARFDAVSQSCYLLFLTQLTWADAESMCMSQRSGGHLVWIVDAAEQAFVHQMVLFDGVQRNLWIGANDQRIEGNFEWSAVTSVDFSYTNWAAAEPNNQSNEDCVQHYVDGSWNDQNCMLDYPFICRLPRR